MINDLFSWLIRVFTGVHTQWRRQRLPEAGQTAVYFANHSSHLDFLVIWAALPQKLRWQTRPVAARDYWAVNSLRKWFAETVFRAVLIERKQVTRDNNPIGKLGEILQNKESVILFPEGTRGDGTCINPLKSGLYHLAHKYPEAELVPVYLNNLNRVLPKGEILPIPFICSIKFGESIELQPNEPKSDFLLRAREAIEALS